MAKLIIYDNKNTLVADLDRTESRKIRHEFEIANNAQKGPISVFEYEYKAIFKEYKIIHSFSLKKQLKKIEKIFKYHKERK